MTPHGETLRGELPAALDGGHFGVRLRAFILHQYHHGHVTQPLLREQLGEWGIEISAGQLNRLISEPAEAFHAEKEALLRAGLAGSDFVHVDDTGARHRGANGFCTHIGKELFACFASTDSKSRINFLELLRVLDHPVITLHDNLAERDIRDYVKKRKISGSTRSDAGRRCRDTFASVKKTCRKHRISFWDYLLDRLALCATIPWLPSTIFGAEHPAIDRAQPVAGP